jgi:hypothetical protein
MNSNRANSYLQTDASSDTEKEKNLPMEIELERKYHVEMLKAQD